MKKLLKYLKPYKAAVIWAIVLTLLSNAMTLVLPMLMSLIVNNGITQGDLETVKNIGAVMLAVSAAAVLISVACSYFSSKASMGFGAQVRYAVFTKVETLAQCDIDLIGTPSLITRCTNDINRIQELLITGIRIIISAPIMLFGGIIMSVILNPKLSLCILAIFPVVGVIALVISKKVMPLFSVEQKKTDNLNRVLREKLTGIRVIRAFNKTAYEDGRFRQANLDLTSIALKINRIFAGLIPLAVFLVFSFIILVIWYGGNQIAVLDAATHAKEISDLVGDLQAFVIYLIMIVFSVSMAAAMFILLPRAGVSAKRINEVLDMETAIKEPEKSKGFNGEKSGELRFENVSFGYPGAEENVISNVSFVSRPGEVTAVIGSTGGGKSTLVNLIPRFYDVTQGAVYVSGTDVRDVTAKELHSKIGFVPQKASLFSGSVADNIRFGKPDATDEEIWKALEIACAADFVRETEGGLDAVVSQNGMNFSGGQKQRLSIARAIVSESEIFVFDDSFSALDFATDAKVRRNIREHLSHANVIIVAQRVGTIMDADRIIVLDEGSVAGIGTHSQLMAECSVYREIVESQLTKEDLAK